MPGVENFYICFIVIMRFKKHSFFLFFILAVLSVSAQNTAVNIKPDADKKFDPYIMVRHGGQKQFEEFKKNSYSLYRKELWYYSESFYIKRDYYPSGVTMDDAMIDVSRFESRRKPDGEVVVDMPGFKDALILIPGNKLVFKP